MRISDCSSDVCSSDLQVQRPLEDDHVSRAQHRCAELARQALAGPRYRDQVHAETPLKPQTPRRLAHEYGVGVHHRLDHADIAVIAAFGLVAMLAFEDQLVRGDSPPIGRAQSELQSPMRNSYAVFCLNK